jgi:hypothetical protein
MGLGPVFPGRFLFRPKNFRPGGGFKMCRYVGLGGLHCLLFLKAFAYFSGIKTRNLFLPPQEEIRNCYVTLPLSEFRNIRDQHLPFGVFRKTSTWKNLSN